MRVSTFCMLPALSHALTGVVFCLLGSKRDIKSRVLAVKNGIYFFGGETDIAGRVKFSFYNIRFPSNSVRLMSDFGPKPASNIDVSNLLASGVFVL